MKKYCVNCGELIPTRSRTCSSCGVNTRDLNKTNDTFYEKNYSQNQKSDNHFKATYLYQTSRYPQRISYSTLFFPILAYFQANRKERGITIFGITLTMIFLAVLIPMTTEFYYTIYFLNPFIAIFMVWSFIDAVRTIRDHNRSLNQQDQIPSQKVYSLQ